MELFLVVLFALMGLIIYKLLDRLLRLPMLRLIDTGSKYILITGCDSGFGHGLATSLDEKGCYVIAACLTEKGETELRKFCSSRLNTVHMDVSKHGSIVEAFQTVKGFLPPGKGLWGVVNNAGVAGSVGFIEWLTVEAYLEALSVNLLGMIDVTTTFLPLVKNERGRIINMSSASGRLAAPMMVPYAITKYGVEAFSDGLRRQLKEAGVSVHIIEPGKHETPLPTGAAILRNIRHTWADSPIENKTEKEEQVQVVLSQMEKFLEAYPGQDAKYVVEAYEHALLAMFPRARYVVGPDAQIITSLLFLPEWLIDPLLRLSWSSFNLPYID